jgi:hypothetical protein
MRLFVIWAALDLSIERPAAMACAQAPFGLPPWQVVATPASPQ